MDDKRIFKYLIPCGDEVAVSMPAGAEVLTVQTQSNQPCIWAVVKPENPPVDKWFCIRGTGHSFKGNEGKFLGTFQLDRGELVFHVFEMKEKETG